MADDSYFQDGFPGDGTPDDGFPVLAFSDGSADNTVDGVGNPPEAESDIYADWYPILSDSQLSLSNIDTNLTALADYLMQKPGPMDNAEEAVQYSSPEESGADVPLTATAPETIGPSAAEGETDIYAQKLDTIIELQTALNDNLVKSYGNLYQSLLVMVLITSFIVGSLFVSFLLSKVRV